MTTTIIIDANASLPCHVLFGLFSDSANIDFNGPSEDPPRSMIVDGETHLDVDLDGITPTVVRGVTAPTGVDASNLLYDGSGTLQIMPSYAAIVQAHKVALVTKIGSPLNPASGTDLAIRLAGKVAVTVEGGTHHFSLDEDTQKLITSVTVSGLAALQNPDRWPMDVDAKLLTSDVPPVALTITATDAVDIGYAVKQYVWHQKQYAGTSSLAIMNPDVTTVTAADAIYNAMSWPSS